MKRCKLVIEDSIKNLKDYIKDVYEKTNRVIGRNIFRGHSRSISTDIEDGIAILIASLLDSEKFKILLDPSIYVANKNHRPDILVVNEKNEVVFMIEVKANMGWCRDAGGVLNGMMATHKLFHEKQILTCKIEENQIQVSYGNPRLFLVSLTDGNCNAEKHALNKSYAQTINVKQYNLFSGWYGSLYDCEINEFCKDLLEIQI